MIFRRPNAFIIKHLKLIHTIILVCLTYTLIKTNVISNTYEHIKKVKSIIGESYTTELYNVMMFVALIVGLILVLLILLLLIKKKKKFVFYIFLIILFIATLVFDVTSYSNIMTMQKHAVSTTTYLFYSDVSKILFYIQSVFVFFVLFKATGFDIKTFSFGKVSGIDLSESDSEEIEFSLDIDGNEFKTKQRRKIRELKYQYLENKLKINLLIILLTLIGGIFVLISLNKKQTYLNLGDELSTQKYNVVIKNVYVTNIDKNGNKIGNNDFFVILTLKLKKNIESEYQFNYSKISIEIGDKTIRADSKYYEYFSDFGEPYKDQNLTKNYIDYYLVYHLPYEFSTDELNILVSSDFDYEKKQYNYFVVKANCQKMEKFTEEIHEYYIHENMNINAYGIQGNLTIDKVDFSNKYKINSNEEINGKNYELIEYLVPTPSDNEEKTIMRVSYKSDDTLTNLSTLLLKYAIIEYDIDGLKKEGKIYTFLSSTLLKNFDVLYVQVSKNVLKGNNRVIKIKIRNQIYNYHLDNKKEDL